MAGVQAASSGKSDDAITAQVGLTRTGVSDICQRFAARGAAA